MRVGGVAHRVLRHAFGLPVAALLAACAGGGNPEALPIDELPRPAGFEVGLFAIVPGAQSLARGTSGAVYVGTRHGEVVRLWDDDRDGVAERAERQLDGLDPPLGVAVGPDGGIFVAERDGVLRHAPDAGLEPVLPEGVLPAAPPDRLRPLAFDADGRLYLGLAPACRSCPTRGLAGSIVRMRPDGHQLEVLVRGVDASGLGWQDATGALLFADRASGAIPAAPAVRGLFALSDAPEATLVAAPAGASWDADEVWLEEAERALSWTFEPGAAPQGIRFYRGTRFPSRFRDGLLVALGPAPGTSPIAPAIDPKVIAIRFAPDGTPAGEEVLLDGWAARDGEPWGRPVDLETLEDGSVLIADDLAGVVYRLSYRP